MVIGLGGGILAVVGLIIIVVIIIVCACDLDDIGIYRRGKELKQERKEKREHKKYLKRYYGGSQEAYDDAQRRHSEDEADRQKEWYASGSSRECFKGGRCSSYYCNSCKTEYGSL